MLRIKDNQKGLQPDIEQLFERRLRRGFGADYTDVDGGHGRVKTRRYWATEVVSQGLVDSDRWASVTSVALIETERN